MARLQKKKTVSQKIKKRQKAAARPTPEAGEGAGAGPEAASSEPAAVKRKPQARPARPVAKVPGEGRVHQWMQFLREVNVELKKVVWPTRKQTVASTIVVIVLVIIISIFLGMVDIGLSALVRMVLQ